MRIQSYQQFAIVSGDSAQSLTEQLNAKLRELKDKDPVVTFEGLIARISYVEREEKPEDMDENAPFVSILGALVDRDSYVIFAHAYSGGKDVSKLGVKFINGRSNEELKDIAWDDEVLSYIKFKEVAIIGKKELMATLYGTRAGTVRMAQAYAEFSDNSIVYGANTTKIQNFQ